MSLPNLFGLWGARDANASLSAQWSGQVESQPVSQPARHTQQSSEQQLWAQYLSRIKPDITPSDSVFQAQLRIFHAALQHDSIESVLHAHFAEYDVWKFVQGRVSKKQYAHVRAQQDRDTVAYKELMRKPGWKDAAGRETLVFKCTMMYFGLPVQPMLFADSVRMSNNAMRLFAPDTEADDDERDGDGDGEDITFVPEEMRPLRFLNHYHRIQHGKDNTHISPERAFELFYTTPMTLRGGSGSDLDDEDSVMHDISSSSKVEEVPSESSETTESLLLDDTDLSVRGGDSAKSEGKLELWGLSGRTIAKCSHGLGSFFWAVDRLLALRSRSDADGGAKGITVSILGHPQGQRTPCNVLWDEHCLLGDRKRETIFSTKLALALGKIIKENREGFDWKICVSQMSLDKHYRDSPQQELSYRPDLRSHQIASFSLDRDQQGALAYLFMPDNVNAGTAANHYQKWFKSLWCTLSRPDPAAEKSYALGSTAIQPPESRFVRITKLADRSAGTEYFLSDVGPPREVWEWLVEAYHMQGQQQFVIDTLPISDSIDNGSLLHIPGYFRGASEKATYENIQEVMDVAMESISEHDRASLQSFWIRPLRFGGFLDAEGAYVLCQDDEGQSIGPDYQEHLQKLQMWLHHGCTLHVQPRWIECEAKILDSRWGDSQRGDLTLTFDPSEPWNKVLARIRTSYTKLGMDSQDAIIRLDQRITSDSDIKHKNRTSWDLETVVTPENSESWSDFVQSLTTKQVTLQLFPRTTLLGTELSSAAPFSLREQQPQKFYWGCHDYPDDVIALHEEGPGAIATAAAASHHHHESSTRGVRHVPERDVDQRRRTTGWEDLRLQVTGRNNLDLTTQGLPARGEGLDDFQRGKIFREWSYGHPLSIHMEGQYPEIPINAPPLEPLIKVPGPDGGISDSVPVISTQLMTATEQRRLQEAFFKMRSLALHRVQECPFPGCRKCFPLDEEGMQSFQKHLQNIHVGKQCPFCHDPLLDSWAPWQITEHFMSKHVDQFSHKGDLRRDLTVPIYSKGLVHSREEQFNFCPRCGRNHEILDAKPDRAQHDNLCFPGNSSDAATTKYCINCGEGYIPLGSLYPHQAHEQECKATPEQREEGMHCHDCGLPTHEFSRRYAHKHVLFCKGAEYKRINWCPWCGIDLALTPRVECYTHLDTCPKKPYTGKNPINTSTGEPLDSPRDTTEIRRQAQHFKPMGQQFVRIDVPKICPIRACNVDLSILNAGGLFKHFYSEHAEATNGMKNCPLCHLDFQARGWAYLDEKRSHLNDHIEGGEEHILADLQVSRAKDRGDPMLFQSSDQIDENDQFQQLVAQEEELAQARDSIIDLQRDRKGLQRKLEDQYLPGPRPNERPSSDWLGKHYAATTNLKQNSKGQAATSGVPIDDSAVAGPSRAPRDHPAAQAQHPGSSSTVSRSRRPTRDATYRPSRRRPSGGDDNYREGEVPEPIPDLTIGSPVEGRRKRARDTAAAEAASVPSGSRTSGSAKKARTRTKEVRTIEAVGEGEAGLPVEISSDSSSGESDRGTPSSGSSLETAPRGTPQRRTAGDEDKVEGEVEDEDEEQEEEQMPGVHKRAPGRPRLDKGKAVAIESGSRPRITRSQAAQEGEEEEEEEEEEDKAVVQL